jgi:GTP-binding protein
MKILSADFIKSVADVKQIPKEPYPHIAIVGRSNVGKSSLINFMVNRKKLAMVSSTPGKTALLNFYLINDTFYLVDFPGYGYARRSLSERERWGALIESYLEKVEALRAVILLIDLRRGFDDEDRDFISWLQLHKHAVIVVYTKCDKLAFGERKRQLESFNKELLQLGAAAGIATSVVQHLGRDEFWKALNGVLR